LLQRPFQVPVDLGHEAEVRHLVSHTLRRLRPERLGSNAPGAFKHVGQHQHGHVAAHAVTLPGDLDQLPDHRVLRLRVAVIEL
jgi:hypothetical protein